MDAFGIGNAIIGAARVYFQSARRTGRTSALLESLQPGDRVVCLTTQQAQHLRQRIKEQDIDATVIVVPTEKPERIFEQSTSIGRTIFDHVWVEQYYLNQLQRAACDIDSLQRQSSGYGQPHLETKLAAVELVKWRPQA
tara:strand:+ start:493 stop:909 length:417 start_codon:yes stop_codon:yes gene_type:complete